MIAMSLTADHICGVICDHVKPAYVLSRHAHHHSVVGVTMVYLWKNKALTEIIGG